LQLFLARNGSTSLNEDLTKNPVKGHYRLEFSSKRNFLKIFVLTKRIATIGYEEISVKH